MATMEVSAVQRYVRRAPRKARLVADSVKGMKVTEALAYLEFSPKHAARDVAKAIKSAAANAEHNFNLNREDLMVKQLLIDEGPAPAVRRPLGDEQLFDHQVFAIEVEVVLGVGSRRLDRLGDVARGVLGRELEVREGFRHLHTLDGVGHEPRFARRAAHVSLHC